MSIPPCYLTTARLPPPALNVNAIPAPFFVSRVQAAIKERHSQIELGVTLFAFTELSSRGGYRFDLLLDPNCSAYSWLGLDCDHFSRKFPASRRAPPTVYPAVFSVCGHRMLILDPSKPPKTPKNHTHRGMLPPIHVAGWPGSTPGGGRWWLSCCSAGECCGGGAA